MLCARYKKNSVEDPGKPPGRGLLAVGVVGEGGGRGLEVVGGGGLELEGDVLRLEARALALDEVQELDELLAGDRSAGSGVHGDGEGLLLQRPAGRLLADAQGREAGLLRLLLEERLPGDVGGPLGRNPDDLGLLVAEPEPELDQQVVVVLGESELSLLVPHPAVQVDDHPQEQDADRGEDRQRPPGEAQRARLHPFPFRIVKLNDMFSFTAVYWPASTDQPSLNGSAFMSAARNASASSVLEDWPLIVICTYPPLRAGSWVAFTASTRR